mmetsp:Transcript_16753/g.29348  ORF Transcript_16753/g.29348 Transcript_16753/m.29348 type:complete len:81 (-) Transcript_16753:724-966(-)
MVMRMVAWILFREAVRNSFEHGGKSEKQERESEDVWQKPQFLEVAGQPYEEDGLKNYLSINNLLQQVGGDAVLHSSCLHD